MTFPRRPVDALLTLLDIQPWTLSPQQGLADLLALGRIDLDALRTMQSLAALLQHLPTAKAVAALDGLPALRLVQHIADGDAVDEELIEQTQRWLIEATTCLRQTKRSDYQHALNILVNETEKRALHTQLSDRADDRSTQR